MRKYIFWLYLLIKRMIKKPAYLLLLCFLPVLSVVMTALEKGSGENTGMTVGILFEREEQEAVTEENAAWNDRLTALLTEQEGTESAVIFRLYQSSASFLRDIEKGKLDCGVMLPADIRERIMADTWQGSVTLYRTASTSMTEIVKEKTACMLFTLYSEDSYVNYIKDSAIFPSGEEIGEFAKKAYESHLIDGSTFAFEYHGESYDIDGEAEGSENETSGKEQPLFRLKGILAVCIFLSGLCGLLTDWNDREERRFVRMAPGWVTTMVNIWIPTIYTSVITLICLLLTGQLAGEGSIFAGIGKELCHLIFYQFLIVAYCSIIKVIIRKQESAAAAIPILTLASMVCCPVWIRLAVYLPVFHVLERLFPVTYYLML